ncbi:uncharacterized protein LOC121601053 isoform X2 [Anopheles merus]|uniref:uncharacterized protein LOC121601053 isoform X2 n=1 Tax=Anopheles merus TaxID=30066 RepID=UPI001BE4D06E|nr:uncharacterized protein LOC121601053 isoform X2 [Anopheles merus]
MEVVDNPQPQSDSDDDSVVAESIGGDSVPDDSDPGIETSAPDSPFGSLSYEDGLRLWALKTGHTHSALNLLLGHLRQHDPGRKLPRDARTFLNTPVARSTQSAITPISGGEIWYQGIETCLRSYFRYTQPAVDRFEVDFFVDGLPLYKSSRTQFWPILMGIHNLPNAPVMTVAIFCGVSKPLYAEEYLGQFVDEMNELQRVGIWIGKRHYTVHLRSIIADSPARAFIKCAKSHNAYSACMKCTIITERDGNRVYFPYGAPCESRLHGLFCADKYPDHKIHMTPLVRIHKCDIICDIVVAEAMHLFYKGVMCKLLISWTEGIRDLGCKMTPAFIETALRFPTETERPAIRQTLESFRV